MNKKYASLILGTCILIIVLGVYFIFKTVSLDTNEKIIVHGIENFEPVSSDGENYLLYYPADSRISQKNTIVKEVTTTGDIVREYEIKDSDFRRMSVHQKPNNPNQLYISLFGEPTIDNYFYTYDITKKKFEKVTLDYFDYEVGVDHIMHYGDDTIFQTLVSHKTGDQNIQADTNEFNVSISNYSTKKSFETEYGHAPKWSPLLKFNNKILYGTSGQVNENNEYENSGLGVIDLQNQNVEYKLPAEATDLTPIYSTEENAFILGDFGKIFVYDKNFQYNIHEPFTEMSEQDIFYMEESPPLLLNMNKALFSLYSQTKGSILGIMTFEEKPKFQPLKRDYIESNSNYRILYKDNDKKEIYILRVNEQSESVLVIDNQEFNLLYEIPVENSHLLDFIVKN
ncbi:hypothetical protein C0966_17755 (plasmid) [Bacillus methanolicus]|uniref:hypothetical protein n=1 Tax=Bacillus methanolicus TaxID=1471 RepID=UPI00238021EC|nr:hypothetical protein [Bacillus methanolicus]MDE3841106.1 hypothetical protein [Bacillus methanolicus]